MEKTRRHTAIASAKAASASGPPQLPSNRFFGTAPITDMASKGTQDAFVDWISRSYRKASATGDDLGPYAIDEMHRADPNSPLANAFLCDLAYHVHRYFAFPDHIRLAFGLGDQSAAISTAFVNFINGRDAAQRIYVDAPAANSASRALQDIVDTLPKDHQNRIEIAPHHREIPSPDVLAAKNVQLVLGTGASAACLYSETDLRNLLEWIDRDPARNHAVLDGTPFLGVNPWPEDLVKQITRKCNILCPINRIVPATPDLFLISLTPSARTFIGIIQTNPAFVVPESFRLARPDPSKQSKLSTDHGPIYDAQRDRFCGPLIDMPPPLAVAQATFNLLRMEQVAGDLQKQCARSMENREVASRWLKTEPLFAHVEPEPGRQSCAVAEIVVVDPDIDPTLITQIVARSCDLLGHVGLEGANAKVEEGLNAMVDIQPAHDNAHYQLGLGGMRPRSDITAALYCLKYAYLRAKIAVLSAGL